MAETPTTASRTPNNNPSQRRWTSGTTTWKCLTPARPPDAGSLWALR